MAESSTTRGERPRRSIQISAELQAARERNAEQQAARKAQEKEVDAALKGFLAARRDITKVNSDCAESVAAEERKIDRKAERHRARIAELEEQRSDRVAGLEVEQAKAALTIHLAGRTVEQVAGLLEVSQREARGLIAAGRRAVAAGSDGSESESASGGRGTMAVSGEQRELSGVDGQ